MLSSSGNDGCKAIGDGVLLSIHNDDSFTGFHANKLIQVVNLLSYLITGLHIHYYQLTVTWR